MNFLLVCFFSLVASSEFFEPEATSSYKTCEQSFRDLKFSIILPKKFKPDPMECKFYVSAFKPDVCRLRINFKKFLLASSTSCSDEFIKIGDRRLCGSIFGTQEIAFSETSTVIQYRGNSEHDFEIEIEQIRCERSMTTAQDCDVISSDTNTEITSPNYPEPYPTPIICSYKIRPSSDNCQILIRFLDFNVPESVDCLKGRLQIDGKSYCGFKTGWTVASNATGELSFDFVAGTGHTGGFFRVAVEQVPCMKTFNISASQIAPPIGPFPPQCCNRIYNGQNFILASPGFLQNHQQTTNCVYQIMPATPSTCRLKFIFLHFWLSQEDIFYGCTDGFLEIDGRRICGCKDGLVIDSNFNDGIKTIWLNARTFQSKGFLIEVQQEDCNYNFRGRSAPEETTRTPDTEIEVFTVNKTIEKVKSRFFVPSDDSRCYQWGLPHWLDKVRAILTNNADQCPIAPPIIPPPSRPVPPIYPPPTRPVPPISPPPIFPPIQPVPPINPPPSFPPIQPLPPISPPPGYPPSRPVPPIIYPPQIPHPPILPPFPGCRVFGSLRGGLQSPGYPWSYPPNQKCCFRFQQAPGFCHLQLTVLDFDILWSPKCYKDFLLLDRRARYCSKSLQSTAVFLPFRNGFASVDFISDSFFSTRGFRAVFQQIPCYSQNRVDENCRKQPPPITQKPAVSTTPRDEFELGVTPV